MQFKLFINYDKVAFCQHEDPSIEVARILHELAARIAGHPHFSPGHSQPVFDMSRKEVGCFLITAEVEHG